jgi:hypothetical protein
MEELQSLLKGMLAEAEECDRIADSAADVMKRANFLRLAVQFRKMAEEIKATIAADRSVEVSST